MKRSEAPVDDIDELDVRVTEGGDGFLVAEFIGSDALLDEMDAMAKAQGITFEAMILGWIRKGLDERKGAPSPSREAHQPRRYR